MKLHPHLQKATFVARLNRFAARMRCEGQEVLVHIANSGRLKELLRPENPMWLAPKAAGARRRTSYDLALVDIKGILVSADARLPNVLLREAIEAGRVPEFEGYSLLRAEVTFGDSRLDLLLSGPAGLCYVEVKSVTLVENGVGLFPDAPTARGYRHVLDLERAVRQGHRAAAVFLIQRSDAQSFSPNEAADPRFCSTLREAAQLGVEAYAYRCKVTRRQIYLSDPVAVCLG